MAMRGGIATLCAMFLSSSPSESRRRSWELLALISALTVSFVACSASEPGGADSGKDGEDSLSDGDLSGNDGDGTDSPKTPGDGDYCQSVPLEFEPKTPTVFVLVDRSSSMFEGGQFWDKLKPGVLQLIQELQGDVRFGFGAYTGLKPEGALEGVPAEERSLLDTQGTIDLNNYSAIASFYNGLGNPNRKTETPTAFAVQWATDILLKDQSPGDRFILLVSDGQPDYNDDVGDECGVDGVIGELQRSYDKGVRTLVFGIDGQIKKESFDFFAQAGHGEKPNWVDGLGDEHNHLRGRCSYADGWRNHFASFTGRTNSIGLYGTEPGTREAVLNADPAALASQIRSAVSGLKSCIFDLASSNVSVKEGAQGDIFVDNNLISGDQWRLNSPTVLELLGDACNEWQKPEVKDFFAGFACDQIIVR